MFSTYKIRVIGESLKEVKTRGLVDHMPMIGKNCFVKQRERVEKPLAVVGSEKLIVVLFGKTGTDKNKVMNQVVMVR